MQLKLGLPSRAPSSDRQSGEDWHRDALRQALSEAHERIQELENGAPAAKRTAPAFKDEYEEGEKIHKSTRRLVDTLLQLQAKGTSESVRMGACDLAGHADLSERTIRSHVKLAARAGLIRVHRERVSPTWNMPNLYRVNEDHPFVRQRRRHLRLRAPGQKASKNFGRGRQHRTDLNFNSPKQNKLHPSTSSAIPAKPEDCNPSSRMATPSAVPSAGPSIRRNAYRPPTLPMMTENQLELLETALRAVDRNFDAEDLAGAVERLRERVDFNCWAWIRAVKRLGADAVAGLAETVLYLDGHIPREDGGIRDPGAYLMGILRKPSTERFPFFTLEQFRKCQVIDARKAFEETRRAAEIERGERYADWLDEVCDRLERTVGAKYVATWLRDLRVRNVTDDRVTLEAPSRFIRDQAREFDWFHAHAWTETLGRAVSVAIALPGQRNRDG